MPRKTTRPSDRRRLDDESGMSRTRTQKKKGKYIPPPESESEEYETSNSDLESELEMPAKDDSRRKKKAPPPSAQKGRKSGLAKTIKGEQDPASDLEAEKEKETDTKVAPHMLMLLAATYHVGIAVISRPTTSSFVAYAGNAFQMIQEMCYLIADNTLLHQMCPEFFSATLYLYYGHVYFYQILRARASAGSDILTRLEKRVLTCYERVGPPESWPIAAPLIGFIHYFGSHKTEDPMYGWIVPRLPDFSILNDGKAPPGPNALGSLNSLVSGQRIPLIPALQKLVYNFAHEIADFNEGLIRPVGQDAIDATHTFCGIAASADTTANFHSLAYNHCWLAPIETGREFGIIDLDVKRRRIQRWEMPNVPDNADLRTLQGFLGFPDGQSFDWMKRLLSVSSIVNRFFPGSTTLAEIPPLTTLGMATRVSYHRSNAPTPTANKWFNPRGDLTFGFEGYTSTEAGLTETKASLTVSPNADFDARVNPALGRQLTAERQGSFFNDGTNWPERAANPLTEGKKQIDPTRRFAELLATHYDNKGGRA